MSNSESFIQEVTEEVRRDRLYGAFRKYGWIGVVVILGIVGGTAFVEWQKITGASRAQSFGDALIEAFDSGTPAERRAALESVSADGTQRAVLEMLIGSDPAEDKAATLAAMDRVIADTALPAEWRDLAVLKKVIVAGTDLPLADRRAALEGIAVTGRPYRALASEQLAYLLLEEGKTDEAIATLAALTSAQDATSGLRTRAGQVVTALGGAPAAAVAEPAAPAETDG